MSPLNIMCLCSIVEAESIVKPQKMRTYDESQKSQKTVKSMIEKKGGDKSKESAGKKNKPNRKGESLIICLIIVTLCTHAEDTPPNQALFIFYLTALLLDVVYD